MGEWKDTTRTDFNRNKKSFYAPPMPTVTPTYLSSDLSWSSLNIMDLYRGCGTCFSLDIVGSQFPPAIANLGNGAKWWE